MNWPKSLGYVVFFIVPLILWGIAAMATKRRGPGARAFAIVAGSDNRLSLARLQALAWTLVIFGSFVAAMSIHDTIISGTAADQEKAKNDAKKAVENVEKLNGSVQPAEEAARKAGAEKAEAD